MTAFALVSGNKVQNLSAREVMFCVKLGNCDTLTEDKHSCFTSTYENYRISWRCLNRLPSHIFLPIVTFA